MDQDTAGMAEIFHQGDPQLAQVIGAERGGHGNAPGLAECVVLHGTDEIDRHL